MFDLNIFGLTTAFLVLFTTYLVLRVLRKYGSRGALYLPGPPTLPIIGNLLIFPRRLIHMQFSEWARQYGDVISLQVMNKTIIVLNTPTLLKEVFEKKGTSSWNRPASIIVDMLAPDGINFGLCQYADDQWKSMRKLAQSIMSKDSLKRFDDLQQAEMTQTMVDFLHSPHDWHMHIHRFTTSLALGIVYGKRSPLATSPDVRDFVAVNRRFMDKVDFGPVDLFPILQYVPKRWAAWKRDVEHIRLVQQALYERLVDDVQKRMSIGMGNGAFIEDVIRNAKETGMQNKNYISYLGGALLEGADTTSPALQFVVLLACAFPEKQEKAAREIESIIGPQRVPRIGDLEDLTYTRAFISECLRFLPMASLGLPHEMVRDELINGMLYPKGAILLQNTWHMFHDERYFDRPHEFLPERFLEHPLGVKPGVQDDPARRDNLLFGGGRRVCPGIILARTNLDFFAAYTFWAFKLSMPVDPATGRPKPADLTHIKDGLAAAPLPFECDIVPRSKERANVLQQEFTCAAEFLRPYELEITEEDKKYNAAHRDL